ncbi:GNAT family N-acetyltransferase (plasmid) [Streptomyces sp. JL4002]|uniref:GNAT family N-acetyltransferase n=1 Tax=Streptomyces sp. JL4002 TaxID=3404781 RepID=UPI003B28C1C9
MAAIMSVSSGARMSVRPYELRDLVRVLELVEGDRLPGRPAVTAEMFGHSLVGCHPGDAAPALLQEPRTDVVIDGSGEVVGAVGWALHASSGEGLLLWLHCLEDDQQVAQVLVRHVLEQAGRRTVCAFGGPTAMSFAGLPVRNRRGTAVALEAAGFSREDGWRYLYCRFDELRRLPYEVVDIIESPDPYGWYLRLREKDGTHIGKAVVSRPTVGTAVLEWISLTPGADRPGYFLLRQCLAHLADRGIRELVVLLNAHSDFSGDSQDLAWQFHRQAGFQEVDQLHPYTRRP